MLCPQDDTLEVIGMAGSENLTAFIHDYLPGTMLFEENDPGSRMYVIRSGRVRIFRRVGGTEFLLAFLGPGDFFGEMALLENLPRSASAQIVEPSRLIEVDAGTFEEMIRSNAEISARIMRTLASRLRESDRRIRDLLVESAVGRTIEVLRWLLPQGIREGEWVRLKGVATHIDLAAQAGVPAAQAPSVMAQLEYAGCVKTDGQDMLIATLKTLDEYSSFLDLKRKYDTPSAQLPMETVALQQDERLRAMQRLLEALHLTPNDLQARQQALATQYRRYLDLKQRFKGFEGLEA